MKKKQSLGSWRIFFCSILLVCLLTSNSTVATRLLLPTLGLSEGMVKNANGFPHTVPELKMEDDGSVLDLMGIERCGNKNEECLKRRMMAEAHLDYIYTQHHKP